MLVFISDLHLTDGSFPPAVPVARLTSAVDRVLQRGFEAGVQRARLILLGDVLEVIKSPEWLGGSQRPWDTSTDAHQDTVGRIVDSIVTANRPFFEWLRGLPTRWPTVSVTYLPGNHDLAINTAMGEKTRSELREWFAQSASTAKFPTELNDNDHKVLARHGHEWDSNNRTGGKGAPFGDVIVVEVLLRLPLRMAQLLGKPLDDPALRFLFELDNVRPQTTGAMARWLQAGLTRLSRERRDAEEVFDQVFDEIIDVLIDLARSGKFEAYKYASLYIRSVIWAMAKTAQKGGVHRLMKLFPLADDGPSHYAIRARDLLRAGGSPPRYFLCGHTHIPELLPLTSGHSGDSQAWYFNTGTWRRVHRPVDVDRRDRQGTFASHQEECVVVIYSEEEQARKLPAYEYRRVTHGLS